jgi:hypothetical protein
VILRPGGWKPPLLALFFALHAFTSSAQDVSNDRASIFIVVGAGGGSDYSAAFAKWAANWQQACETAGARAHTIGLDEQAEKSLEQLRTALDAEPKDGDAELWLVLLGHGADDKFNLTGDDLVASELAALLKPFQRPVILLNCFSASGSFLAPLAAPGRIVITATKSGSERNYSRFGRYLSEAIADPAADFDKDGQTSVLEAWLAAAQHVAAFYTDEGRLATEHSLLDDNGDGKGTPADWFRGLRVVKKAKDGTPADGLRARQIHLVRNPDERALSAATRAERDALEMELAKLRESKESLPEDAYYRDLETLLRKIAKLYEREPAKAD